MGNKVVKETISNKYDWYLDELKDGRFMVSNHEFEKLVTSSFSHANLFFHNEVRKVLLTDVSKHFHRLIKEGRHLEVPDSLHDEIRNEITEG